MQPQDIHLTDWSRILVGEEPATFYIELLIRALVVYLILVVSMRAMGKRMSSQLSRNELAALVSLAAVIGIPMMAPDRGILPAFVIAIVLISVERLIAKKNFQSQKFESFTQGDIGTLISNGVIDMNELLRVKLARERVFAQLRSQGVMQLGTIARFYMEAGGGFTLVQNPDPVPGLSVLPAWDDAINDCFREYAEEQVCAYCGFPQKRAGHPYHRCPNCGKETWVAAVQEIKNN